MTGQPITLVVAGYAAGASTVLGLVVWLGPSSPVGVAFGPLLTGLAWLGAALALGFAADHVRQVLEHQRVLGARVAPRAASRAASRSSLRQVALGGLALALPLVWLAVAGSPAAEASAAPIASSPTWHHMAAAALSAAGLLHALTWLGVVAWWGRASPVWLALACGAVSALVAVGWAGVLGVLAQVPWLALPALLGAALATRWVHAAMWSSADAPGRARTRSPRQQAHEVIGSVKARFTRVDPVTLPFAVLLPGQVIPWLMHEPARDSLLFVSWGSTFDLHGVARLVLLAAVMCLCLRTGALHWRLLIAPGGRSRASLGPDIVLRSWVAAVALLAAMLLSAFLVAILMGDSWDGPAPLTLGWLSGIAQRFGPTLLCELLLATALATWVRPLVRSSLMAFAVLLGVAGVALAGAVSIEWITGIDQQPAWPRGLIHHLGAIGLAAVFTLLARRQWQRADLRGFVAPPTRDPLTGAAGVRPRRAPAVRGAHDDAASGR